jgi:hypothetical protein
MAEMIMTRGVISIDDLMKNYLRKQANLAKISKTLVVMAIVAAAHYLYQAQFD